MFFEDKVDLIYVHSVIAVYQQRFSYASNIWDVVKAIMVRQGSKYKLQMQTIINECYKFYQYTNMVLNRKYFSKRADNAS